jgi:hypothetical protein
MENTIFQQHLDFRGPLQFGICDEMLVKNAFKVRMTMFDTVTTAFYT